MSMLVSNAKSAKIIRKRLKKLTLITAKTGRKMQDDTSIFTADMQKIIFLPKITLKEHFFVSRLVIFNETFASVKNNKDFVILWHKAISGRLRVDVGSSYIKCANLCEADTVIFWADNCAGQNKKCTL